ncbi:hypothetical protein D9619_006550 [Psilocybe cf. subviscida]|uniref:2'-phosphotransferase n=1 Tax=Psilocybe cf. subviscida TaxID=2480587 RepID=A0A8H5EY43_9AGAR|nr:hypothetical protein D9619_006550 [Psilocybe cf. subviscida]
MLNAIRFYSSRTIKRDVIIKSIFKTEAFRPTATPRKGQTVLQHEMESSAPSETPSKLSIANETTSPSQPTSKGESGRGGKGKGKSTGERREKAPRAQKQALKQNASGSGGAKLRGLEKDSPEVRLSKTFSWLLRHGAQGEGLPMRKDGYVKVTDLLENRKLKGQGLDLDKIKAMVKADSKQRYDLILESPAGVKLASYAHPTEETSSTSGSTAPAADEASAPVVLTADEVNAAALSGSKEGESDGIWWIKARQGHSIKTVQLELKPIASVTDIPTGLAIHGTNGAAWASIGKEGLSKMKRNHIHLAQDVAGKGVVSGMRTSSRILIYIDVAKALDAGIKFWLSDNGVVLTEGNQDGRLPVEFFQKVVDSIKGTEVEDWRS